MLPDDSNHNMKDRCASMVFIVSISLMTALHPMTTFLVATPLSNLDYFFSSATNFLIEILNTPTNIQLLISSLSTLLYLSNPHVTLILLEFHNSRGISRVGFPTSPHQLLLGFAWPQHLDNQFDYTMFSSPCSLFVMITR